MFNTKDREEKRIRFEMKILEELMKKDNISEFDNHYYSRAYRRYKDKLWVIENNTL